MDGSLLAVDMHGLDGRGVEIVSAGLRRFVLLGSITGGHEFGHSPLSGVKAWN